MIGQTIGHYRVLAPLGEGGMGVVYSAEDMLLSRHVALKFLGASFKDNQPAIARFMREARTASALNHPNICTIYQVGEHEGSPFIAMELLQGQTLDRVIDKRPLSVSTLLELGIQLADALDTAHGRVSCTATSSLPTSSSPHAGRPKSSTSASPSRYAPNPRSPGPTSPPTCSLEC